ncbi:MAG: amidohydrolase [Lysobacter sp.]|nr:MAG: amidohydrolase [Lysobacter sp.]
MSRLATLAGALLFALGTQAAAQELLIRNARVHTATSRGTLENADVLVRGGRIAAVGTGLSAPAGVSSIDAGGQPLTPTLFGGITHMGIEEVSGEQTTVDATLGLGAKTKEMTVRPEFDVTLAFNPDSTLVPVNRIEGIGWTLLGAGAGEGGSIIAGQGAVVRLDGSPDPSGPHVLFVKLGSDAAGLSGQSRAAQWMLLEQMFDEARGRIPPTSYMAMLTPAGRAALARFLAGQGLIVFEVERASDIRQLLRFAKKHGLRIAIAGATEAWKLAPQLAAAKVPVFVDPLSNLPADFDRVGARLDNAALLRAAGVQVGIVQAGDASHNARKVRQLAGNAVANGLSWEDGLAALTRVPAEAFGIGDAGRIAVGQRADLVLWSGDPLEVTSVARQVWFDGRAIPMRSRQTELRDRYLRPAGPLPRAYDVPDRIR